MKATIKKAAAVLLCAALVSPASAELSQKADVGWQYTTTTNGNNPPQSKFDEYYVHRTGGVLDYDMAYDKGDYDVNAYVHDMDQSYQNFKLGVNGGKEGLFTYNASWAQIPHELSYDAHTLYQNNNSVAGNYLTIPYPLRSLEQTSAQPLKNNLMLGYLSGAPFTTLQVQSDRGAVDFVYHPIKDATVSFGASRLHKEGTREVGAMISGASPVMLPVPINSTAVEAYVDLGYAKKDYQLDFRYDVSSYHNNYTFVTFDNPFQAGNAGATPAQGTISMEPDNIAHTFSLSGGAKLPYHTRFTAKVGYSLWEQNDALLPLTANPNAGPYANGVGIPNNAGGEIDVYTQDYKFTNTYFDKFRTSLAFRSYDYENHSAVINFPQGLIIRDSNAFSQGEGVTPYTNRYQYRKEDGEWQGDYDLTKNVSLNAGYQWEYKHEDREIPITNEHTVTLGTTYRPDANLLINLSYLGAARRGKGFDAYNYDAPQTPYYQETPGLVRFDIGDRNRNQGRLQVQYNRDTATYGFSLRETQDRYRPGQVPLNGITNITNGNALFEEYGVVQNDVGAAGFNMTQDFSSKFSVDANYEFDYSRMLLKGTSKGSGGNTSDAFDTAERIDQLTNVAGIDFNVKPTKEAKITAGYNFVQTIQHADPLNGAQFGGNDSIAGYTSNSLQATLSRTQTFSLRGHYQVTKDLGVSGRYLFQRYELNDYLTNSIPLIPNTSGVLYMGTVATGYTAQVIGFGADYKF